MSWLSFPSSDCSGVSWTFPWTAVLLPLVRFSSQVFVVLTSFSVFIFFCCWSDQTVELDTPLPSLAYPGLIVTGSLFVLDKTSLSQITNVHRFFTTFGRLTLHSCVTLFSQLTRLFLKHSEYNRSLVSCTLPLSLHSMYFPCLLYMVASFIQISQVLFQQKTDLSSCPHWKVLSEICSRFPLH